MNYNFKRLLGVTVGFALLRIVVGFETAVLTGLTLLVYDHFFRD